MTGRLQTAIATLHLLALALAACRAAEDEAQLRAGYTTNTTLGDDPCAEGSPSFDVNPRRSLFETNAQALQPLSMRNVLSAIASNGGLPVNPVQIHNQLMDTFDEQPGLGFGAHCDDALAFNGAPGLNGYPLECPRAESNQVGMLDLWFPIAAVNRFDLAPSDGASCGQARLVLASNINGRMFTIFEAEVPNPSPGCLEACRPVQEFWASLTNIDDPAARATELKKAFLDGHPTLEAAGFGPFMRMQNLTFGTGQVRTNNFNQGPWTLREHKLVDHVTVTPGYPDVHRMKAVPVQVASNVFGPLWDDHFTRVAAAAACRQQLLSSVPHLMSDDPNLLGFDPSLSDACLAAESSNHLVANNYPLHLSRATGSFRAQIDAAIDAIDPSSGLSAFDIAQRARFAGTCIGCHEETNGLSLGGGVIAPSSLGFVHTSEQLTEPCGDGTTCFMISDALEQAFLPFREHVMESFLEQTGCCTGEDGGPCCETFVFDPPPPPPTPVPPCEPELGYCVDTDPPCMPVFEAGCDPTEESCMPTFSGCGVVEICEPFCDVPPEVIEPQLPACDPTAEGHDPTNETCMARMGDSASNPAGLAMEASAPQQDGMDIDIEAFMAMERQLRAQQSPWTISGRPNVRGH